MSKNIWGDLLTERGSLLVPSELRIKRKELGLNNQEYILLLDYLDHFKDEKTDNVYKALAVLNGISEETIQRRLVAIEKKGLLRREVETDKSGRIKGIVFSPVPLVKKLASFLVDNSSDRDSESEKKTNTKIRSIHESAGNYETRAQEKEQIVKEKKWKNEFCSTRWYNDVFSEMYEEASGQPVLTGGREYKSAVTYFSRFKQLNPELGAEAIFVRATEGARYILDSQLRGGAFGWLHKPPDICMLANQAQAVDYQLRCIEKIYGEEQQHIKEESNGSNIKVLFTKKNKEKENGSEQIERVFEELREIEQRDVRRDFQEGLRKGLSGDKS
ncbi:MAG: hypothetical protein WBA70_02250 [Thermodesulfobacteriota bacterium]